MAAAARQVPDPQVPVVLTYFQLRKAVGIIGFSLPLVLALGNSILERRLQIECSISDYYYTNLGSVFIGSLCAIGVFLISTRGYDWRDELAGYSSGAFAIGVALLRTDRCNGNLEIIGVLHYVCAGSLFVILAIFCLKLFIKTGDTVKVDTRSREYLGKKQG